QASCVETVHAAPTSPGAKSASLSVSRSEERRVGKEWSSTGLRPAALTITPSSKDLGGVVTGGSSADQQFVVRNTGDVPTGSLSVSLGGENASDVVIAGDQCSGTHLGAQASCVETVHAAPTSPGAKSASLSVS